jgi:alpha(1,3/1,4) fucosyltransferase
MSAAGLAVFIDPFSYHQEQDRLFDVRVGAGGGDDVLAPWVYLHDWLNERGVRVHTADLLAQGEQPAGSTNVYLSLGERSRYRKLVARPDVIPSAFFAFECPVVEPRLYLDLHSVSLAFRRMFSFSNEEALRPFLSGPVRFLPMHLPQAFDDVHEGIWHRTDRKFLTLINANKVPRLTLNELYTERLRAVEFFNRYSEIDLYGVGWDGPPMQVGTSPVPAVLRRAGMQLRTRWDRLRPSHDPLLVAAREAYRGAVDSKAQSLGSYTFAVCFENMILEGWITEKIFDCFFAGAVPIYLGAPDIERSIPPECFIDMRRFGSYEELRSFLYSLGPAEIASYRQAARAYLRSDGFRPFSKQALAELVASLIAKDTGVVLA